jgi:Zinc knuckle
MIPTNAQPRAKDAAYQADAGPSHRGKKNPRGGKQSNATGAGQTELKKELCCWNCEEIGHWKTECPSPAHEKSGRGDGTSKAIEATNALDDHEVTGSWMAVVPDNSKEDGGDELTVDVNMAAVASMLATEDNGSVDLYDSGMTQHISPDRERFISLETIKPKRITGAG